MKRKSTFILALALFGVTALPGYAQHKTEPTATASTNVKSASTALPSVEIELLTWPEIKRAIQEQGKTTVLVYNGGTEQRGPQGVTGKHTFTARNLGRRIAETLGDALLAPVLPYSVDNANPELPGTIGVTGELFSQINEAVAEQLIANGFKKIVLLCDSGGGQKELAELAKKLTEKHAAEGVRVIHVDDVYRKAGTDFNKWLQDNGYPVGAHAGIKDTSELLYLEGSENWVRKELLPTAVGDLARKPGEPRDPNAKRINNGISGDARRSSPEIGKRIAELKVEYGVAQIRQLLATSSGTK